MFYFTTESLTGEVMSPVNVKNNCHFCTRCKHATDKCHNERPALQEIAPNHFVACHMIEETTNKQPTNKTASNE